MTFLSTATSLIPAPSPIAPVVSQPSIVTTQVYTGGGYDPNSPVFASLSGSPDAPGSGMAINPATGKLEQVYATYAAPDSDSAIAFGAETRRYFASDFDRPGNAMSLAGYAPGFYDHSGLDVLEVGILGGLAAIGGVAVYSVATGAAGAAAADGVTADAVYGGETIGTGTVTGAGETSATVVASDATLASGGEGVVADQVAYATTDQVAIYGGTAGATESAVLASGAEGVVADQVAYGTVSGVADVTGAEGVVASQVYDAAGASVVSGAAATTAGATIASTLSSAAQTIATLAQAPLIKGIIGAVTGANRTAVQPKYLPQQNLSGGLLGNIYPELSGPAIGGDDSPGHTGLNPTWILAGAFGLVLIFMLSLLRR